MGSADRGEEECWENRSQAWNEGSWAKRELGASALEAADISGQTKGHSD